MCMCILAQRIGVLIETRFRPAHPTFFDQGILGSVFS